MTKDEDFELYLKQCTDSQVFYVFEKEKKAGREEYAMLAETEAYNRGFSIVDLLDFIHNPRGVV